MIAAPASAVHEPRLPLRSALLLAAGPLLASPLLAILLLAVLLGALAAPALGQSADSLRAAPAQRADSVRTRPPARPPLGFGGPGAGIAVTDTLPIVLPELDLSELLLGVPGSFLYAFGTPGWPDGWSPYGLPPHEGGAALSGIPFDDLVTGRPRLDLLPAALLLPPRVSASRYGEPVALDAHMRPFDTARPLTELRYVRGSEGLQSVDVAHAQRRRLTVFGRDGLLQLVGAYGGRAADGEYPGSDLRRARQSLVRLRFARPGWSLELMNLHNRRRVGAQGGVLPDAPDVYETIFRRTAAAVDNPQAERRTVRNDLSARLRARLLPLAAPFSATTFWSAETFRYRDGGDTLAADADRIGLVAAQPVAWGGHRAQLSLGAWRSVAALRTTGARDEALRLHLAASDSFTLAGLDLYLEAGLHRSEGELVPGGAGGVSWGTERLRLFAEATRAPAPSAAVMRLGWGDHLAPASGSGGSSSGLGRAGVEIRRGVVDLLAFGFATRREGLRDYFATSVADSVVLLTSGGALTRPGAAADLGWRRHAERGLYAIVQPTVFLPLGDASSVAERLGATLPRFFGRSRLGARFTLFRRDLDLDVYLEGRLWSTFRSRHLHPQTGLLLVPAGDDRVFGPSGTLDLLVQAGLRGATIFLAYENFLSGTPLMLGTLLVPDYPLPEQTLRFGVYWPIFD